MPRSCVVRLVLVERNGGMDLVERGVVCKTILRGMLPSGRKAIRWVLAKHFDHAIHSDEPCVAVGPKSQKSLF